MKTIALISNFLTSVLVVKDQKYVKKKVSHERTPHSFHWQVGQFQKWTLAIALISNFMASVLALKDEKRGSIRKKDRLIHIHFKKSFWLCGILLRIYFFIFLIMKTVSLLVYLLSSEYWPTSMVGSRKSWKSAQLPSNYRSSILSPLSVH